MSNIVTQIQEAMASDDDDQSDRLRRQYEEASPEHKAVLDEAFISLCGWSLKTLIERDDDGGDNDEEKNDG